MLPDGYPRREAYEDVPHLPSYRELNEFSAAFRQRNAAALDYYSAIWVADPLRHWSRLWEYPFVHERLARTVAEAAGAPLTFFDAGSGLTFFPHWLANRHAGVSVRCGDRDARIVRDARRLLPPASPAVSYEAQDLAALRYPDASFDAIYCISVLEHCRNHEAIAAEFARTLKPGGQLILTIDVSLDGRKEIPPDEAAALIRTLARFFSAADDYATMVRDIEPSRVVTTDYVRTLEPGSLPWTRPGILRSLRHLGRAGLPGLAMLRRRLLSGGHRAEVPALTCFCMSWISAR